jgi:succinoglycan biosynthesis protein ExoO
VADNLIEFDVDNLLPPRPLFTGRWANHPFWIDIVDYISLNHLYGPGPALGYLKPLFRAATLTGARYDETLRIAEDYDLVVRLLHSGKSMRVYPFPLYFYRKHARSISHRLNETALNAIRAADLQFLDQLSGSEPRVIAAMQAKMRSTETALAFEQLLNALKTAKWLTAIRTALTRPRAVALLRLPLGARMRRLVSSRGPRVASALPFPPEKFRLP